MDDVPEAEKVNNPMMGVEVAIGERYGVVRDMRRGAYTGELLYEVQCENGDLRHLTQDEMEEEVADEEEEQETRNEEERGGTQEAEWRGEEEDDPHRR